MRLKKNIIALVFILTLIPLILQKSGFFIYERPVYSKILLIEGWLPTFALETLPFDIKKYDTVFIVGINQKTNWENIDSVTNHIDPNPASDEYWLPGQGFLFLSLKKPKPSIDTIKTIRIIAKGTKAKGLPAHFYISIKDSILGNTFVKENYDTFCFQVNLDGNKIPGINLYFDNDLLTQTEDINLVVKEIMLNNMSYSPLLSEFIFIKASQKNNSFKLFDSNASETAYYLKNIRRINVPLIVIDTTFYKRNLTLASAKAFGNYLIKNNIRLNSLNIYTLDYHSRRTYIAYKKVLGPKIQIGSIINSCPDCTSKRGKNFLKQYWHSLDELISLVATWL